jgi:sugar lactone lactonase YvrE
LLKTQVLVEEARRLQRRRRRWAIGLVAVALVAASGALAIMHLGGAGAAHPRLHHHSVVSPPGAPAPVPATPPALALDRPEGIAVEPDGSLLIANQGTNQILRYMPSTGQLQAVAGDRTADPEIDAPSGVATEPDGTAYFADGFGIGVIAPVGAISTLAPSVGLGPFNGVAVGPNGAVYVADRSGVQEITPAGDLTTVIEPSARLPISGNGFERQALTPTCLAVDQRGNIYLCNIDSSPKTVDEFSPTGQFLMAWEVYADGLAVAPDGSILVADYNGPLERITGPGLTAGATAEPGLESAGLSVVAGGVGSSIPGMSGVFVGSAVAVSSTGEVYAVSDGASSFGGTALISIDPDGQVHILDTGPDYTAT